MLLKHGEQRRGLCVVTPSQMCHRTITRLYDAGVFQTLYQPVVSTTSDLTSIDAVATQLHYRRKRAVDNITFFRLSVGQHNSLTNLIEQTLAEHCPGLRLSLHLDSVIVVLDPLSLVLMVVML